jgi:hypothetical protein
MRKEKPAPGEIQGGGRVALPNYIPPRVKAILHVARLGYDVFPIKENEKVPLVPWKEVKTANEDTITQWFSTGGNNVALAADDCIIIDVDPGGIQWAEEHRAEFERLGVPTVKTPRGGYHFYFQRPRGKQWKNSTGKIAPGVDIRTGGGYVLIPPSEINGR